MMREPSATADVGAGVAREWAEVARVRLLVSGDDDIACSRQRQQLTKADLWEVYELWDKILREMD